MSKYSNKTIKKILDNICKRVTEISTMESSFICTALSPSSIELALLYMRLNRDENNKYADTANNILATVIFEVHKTKK